MELLKRNKQPVAVRHIEANTLVVCGHKNTILIIPSGTHSEFGSFGSRVFRNASPTRYRGRFFTNTRSRSRGRPMR